MLCGSRIKRMRRKKEQPTYFLSTLTEAQVLGILAESKSEMISPRTSFQQQNPNNLFVNLNHFSLFSEIIRNPLSDVMWFGLPSSGWIGALQVRGGKENRASDP